MEECTHAVNCFIANLNDPARWEFYAVTFFCLLLGAFLSYLGEMKELNSVARAAKQPPPDWKAYYRDFPYATTYSVLSSVLGYFLLMALDELSIITAIGMGFVGETVSDSAGARAKRAIGAIENNE